MPSCGSRLPSLPVNAALVMSSTSSAPQRHRVLFVNRSYWPDTEATGQLLTELCDDLSGPFEITVIAGQPNSIVQAAQFKPHGWDRRGKVAIRRLWHTRFPKANLLGRAVNYLTFVISATIAALTVPKPDVIVVQSDPPLLCFVGALVRKLRGAKLVVYLQDIYPDIAVALGKLPDNFTTRWLRRAMFAVYCRADRVVVLSRDMHDRLVAAGVPADRIACVPNWVDTTALAPVKHDNSFRRKHDVLHQFVVMYSGNLGLCQRLEDVLEAARLLRHRTDIVFLLIGEGVSKARLKEEAMRQELTNVRFLPYQPKEQLSLSLSAAQLHLVPIDPRIAGCLMPSKLYGALASGTPVLAVAPDNCELAELVEELQVGTVCPPCEPAQLAIMIQRLAASPDQLAAWGLRARLAAQQLFDRSICTASFRRQLECVVNGQVAAEPAHAKVPPQGEEITSLESAIP